jgi:hypothetical protein
MITVFLLPHLSHKIGNSDLLPQKPLEYSRGVKRINCIVDVPISLVKGVPTCKKKLNTLSAAGIETIEDLFKATEQTLLVLKEESFYPNILTAWENVQKHVFIYKENMKIPKHLYLNRKYKTKEEKLIVLGISIFDPIFKSKKIARNTLIEKLPLQKVNDADKKKRSRVIRIQRQKNRKLGLVG